MPSPPPLPERAAIYIAPDGSVHFGALFAGLLPVAEALGGARAAGPALPFVSAIEEVSQDSPLPEREAGPPPGSGSGG